MRTSVVLVGLASAVLLLASACGGGEDHPSVTLPATPSSTPSATAADGELRLGDTATIGDKRVTLKEVAYGVSECERKLKGHGVPPPRISVKLAGYEVVCVVYDEVQLGETEADLQAMPTRDPSYVDALVDSAGEIHEDAQRIASKELAGGDVTVSPGEPTNVVFLFGIPQGRRALAYIFRDSETGEEARWSLK